MCLPGAVSSVLLHQASGKDILFHKAGHTWYLLFVYTGAMMRMKRQQLQPGIADP